MLPEEGHAEPTCSYNRRDMRKLIVFALMLVLPISAAFARATISGKIKDAATGESIPAVAVVVEGANRGAAANVEGFFSIPNLEDGEINSLCHVFCLRSVKMSVAPNTEE